jgi:hypothetical protein
MHAGKLGIYLSANNVSEKGTSVRTSEPFGDVFHVHGIVSVTELRMAAFSEAVFIPNQTPYIEVQAPPLLQIAGSIANVNDRTALLHLHARGQRYLPLKLFEIEVESFSTVVEACDPFDKPTHITSREVAYILDDDIRVTFGNVIGCRYSRWFNADIGTLEDPHLVLAALVQLVGRLPEQNGGHYKSEGEPPNKKTFVAIHKPDSRRRKTASATTEVWGVFGLLGYLLIPIVALVAGRRWDWLLRAWVCSLGLGGLLAMLGLI